MVQMLVYALVAILFFAILALGMKWVCDKFFPNFQPALWICGVILIILMVVAAGAIFNSGGRELHFP